MWISSAYYAPNSKPVTSFFPAVRTGERCGGAGGEAVCDGVFSRLLQSRGMALLAPPPRWPSRWWSRLLRSYSAPCHQVTPIFCWRVSLPTDQAWILGCFTDFQNLFWFASYVTTSVYHLSPTSYITLTTHTLNHPPQILSKHALHALNPRETEEKTQ